MAISYPQLKSAAPKITDATHYVANEMQTNIYTLPSDNSKLIMGALQPGTAVQVIRERVKKERNHYFHEIKILSSNVPAAGDLSAFENINKLFYIKDILMTNLKRT